MIPTNSSEKSSIVLKAGQKVMVLKSPKGIYMQLETGKIIAIKTSFKVGQNKPVEAKEIPKKSKFSILSSYTLNLHHNVINCNLNFSYTSATDKRKFAWIIKK